MARRRYGRRRRRSGRWAPNIVKISNTINANAPEWFYEETLAENPIQQNTGVSQTFTAKNFEINFTIEDDVSNSTSNAGSGIESVTAYIMFVPQGMVVDSTYYANHPEYIMAYKYLGSPHGLFRFPLAGSTFNGVSEIQQYQPFRIKSRLSRKLQTGDRIVLYIQGSNQYSDTLDFNINGIIRWWSKAN